MFDDTVLWSISNSLRRLVDILEMPESTRNRAAINDALERAATLCDKRSEHDPRAAASDTASKLAQGIRDMIEK
jgi:hypothetical protein